MIKTILSAALFWLSLVFCAPASGLELDIKESDKSKLSNGKTRENLSGTIHSPHPKPEFTFGPEDLIKISVWGNEELTTEVPVRPDGYISFPLVGDIRVEGLTPQQLTKRITKKLRKFISDTRVTVVTVIVKEINSIKISVAGEINEPGTYNLNRPITLLHLFSLVKGFTEKADLKRSYVLRNGKKLGIDFFALIRKDDFSQNIWLQPNDFIFIHDNFKKRVKIIGEVNKPQIINFREGMTVLDAVLMAEGLTEIAKPDGTLVYRHVDRPGGNRKTKKIKVDLDEVIFSGKLSQNVQLKSGDIVLIPRSFF